MSDVVARQKSRAFPTKVTADAARSLVSRLAPLVLLVVFSLTTPEFFTVGNLQSIGLNAGIVLVLAAGTTYVILIGGIDLSQASLLGLAEVVSAKLAGDVGALCFPVAMVGGAAAGFVSGLAHTRLRVPSFLATLGIGSVWLSTALVITGGNLVYVPQSAWSQVDWVRNNVIGVPIVDVVAAGVVAGLFWMERRTRYGRSLFVIGAGEEAARASGVPVLRYKVLTFGLSGVAAASAGSLYAGQLTSGNPEAGSTLLLLAIVVVVVGGTPLSGGSGGIARTVSGALTMTILVNGMTFLGISPITQELVIGPVLIVAVAATLERGRVVTK